MILKEALSWLTFLSHILIVLGIIYFIMRRFNKLNLGEKALRFFGKNSMIFSLAVVFASLLGSLYFSEIMGFDPCKLCWYQRIFIYPQALLFLAAIMKKKKDVFTYALPLTIIGGIIALYHSLLKFLETNPVCSLDGISCTMNYFTSFGYITIPVMSLTAFISLIMLAITYKFYGD